MKIADSILGDKRLNPAAKNVYFYLYALRKERVKKVTKTKIAEDLNLSRCTVITHCKKLRALGYLDKNEFFEKTYARDRRKNKQLTDDIKD